MAKQIYRKSLLERMSSPDQLDKMIVITPPSFWVALLGGAVIVAVTLVWSIVGRLPINLEANGIFVSDQRAFTLASETGGIVATLEVEIGDPVEEGDVLLTLADESMQQELDALLDRRARVEAVTLTSVDDVVTTDNRDLINLKTQISSVSVEGDQNQAMLAVYQSELASLRPKVTAAKNRMESAREEYYSYIASTADSEIEIAFSEAQAAYSQNMPILSSNLSSAELALSNARSAYQQQAQAIKASAISQIDAQLGPAQTEYTSAAAEWQSLEEDRKASEQELAYLEEQLQTLQDELDAESLEPEQDDAIRELENDISTAETDLQGKTDAANGKKGDVDAAKEVVDGLNALKAQVNGIAADAAPEAFAFLQSTVIGPLVDSATLSGLQDAYSSVQQAQASRDEAKSAVDQQEQAYQDARKAYTDYNNDRAEENAEKEQLAALYNQYNNDYSTLYSQQSNLEANITSIRGQVQAAIVGSAIQGDSYEEQFEATRAAVLSSLDAEIERYRYNLEKTSIRATVSGTVTDMKVGVGAAVGQGAEVVTIRQFSDEDCIICYIPISSGKKVVPGMEVIVCPTTINRQEYGHMKADVVAVDDYVTPASSIRSTLGDDMLAQAFTQNGPVVAVTCRLRTDEYTASGYWWSSKKGADLIVADGTLVTVDIVTEEKAPITMLIPFLKEKLSSAVKPVDKEGR
ncbi:MAG: NHLP bacteriocin system secretion protein [Oscillospiraceae bacterium]|nr:NHLP bacteriocin system secretion protein [Oscillospiraceae bacterium]